MVGTTFKNREDGKLWKIVANTGTAWVMTTAHEFGPNIEVPVEELRKQFVKATNAAAPAPTTLADEEAGWQALSANQKLASLAQAAANGDIHAGHVLTQPTIDGGQTPSRDAYTSDDIGRLKRLAAKLTKREPTPEEVFAQTLAEGADQAAQKIIGNPDALASYEVGALDCGPAVQKIVDAHIERRNFIQDRKA